MKSTSSIWHYTPTAWDLSIRNPYLRDVLAHAGRLKESGADEMDLRSFRDELICEYAFSIPYQHVLQEICLYSPLVEIGAGSGYWAWCLTQSGADVIAYDSNPPSETDPIDPMTGNRWFHDEWIPVTDGDADTAGKHPDRSLFMAWPEPVSLMSSRALYSYLDAGGKTLVYIGDTESSGDDIFHKKLKDQHLVHSEKLYGWPGIGDCLFIYKLG